MIRKLFLFLSFSLLFSVALMGERLFVRGYVMDSKDQAIYFANVFLKASTQGTNTNEKGYYELAIETQQQDSVTLLFSCLGYLPKRFTIATKQTHQSYQLSVKLEEDAALLNAIEVRSLHHNTSTMQSINTKDLQLVPDASGGNIESLLTQVAGVSSTNELSSQYSVRGGNYDENSVYVNGIEIYRPLLIRAGQQEGLSFVNPDMVESVAFSAGGFDAQYGDKMASVLQVAYKKPKELEGHVSASLLGASAYVGHAAKGFTQVHGLRYKTSQYMLGTLDTKGEYAPTFFDYQTYLTYQISPKWSTSFLGNISQNTYKFVPQDRQTSFGGAMSLGRKFSVAFQGQELDIFRTFFGAYSLDYQVSDFLKMRCMFSAFNTNEQETYDITGEYWLASLDLNNPNQSKEESDIQGVGAYHEHARNRLSASVFAFNYVAEYQHENGTLSAGVTAQKEVILDRIREWNTRDSAGYLVPFDPTAVRMQESLVSHNDMYSYRATAYIQEKYKLENDLGDWHFTGGVRVNYWDFNQETLISPRFSCVYIPEMNRNYNFRIASGVYYQAPFYKEVRQQVDLGQNNFEVQLNPNIKAQRSLHFLAGMDYYFRWLNRPFKLTIESYYKPSDRVISYYVDNVRVRYSGKNDSKAYSAGIDFKLFGEIVPGTDSWVSLSLMQSKENILDDSYTVKNNVGEELGNVAPSWIARPNEQRYNLSFFFQDYFPQHPEYKVHMKFVFADGLPFGPPASERYLAVLRTPSYKRFDAGISRGFVQGKDAFMRKIPGIESIWLNLEVFNVFDIPNVNSYYWVTDIQNAQYAVPNYLTGRMINLKLSVRF